VGRLHESTGRPVIAAAAEGQYAIESGSRGEDFALAQRLK
jgi:hypothetical protein